MLIVLIWYLHIKLEFECEAVNILVWSVLLNDSYWLLHSPGSVGHSIYLAPPDIPESVEHSYSVEFLELHVKDDLSHQDIGVELSFISQTFLLKSAMHETQLDKSYTE